MKIKIFIKILYINKLILGDEKMIVDFFHSRQRMVAAAFVDYEHWYYSYLNEFNMRPNIEEWYDEIKKEFDVKELKIFGDFSKEGIAEELLRLESIMGQVIHTANTKRGVEKDFTDFIILDSIYQKAAEKKCPDVFILFTGDGHFDLAVQYLRKIGKKVLVYGVKRSLSEKLKSSANSYVEMPRVTQEREFYYNLILKSLKRLDKSGKKATYRKTVANVAESNGISEVRIKGALDELMDNRYIIEKLVKYMGKPFHILEVHWDQIRTNGIWNEL